MAQRASPARVMLWHRGRLFKSWTSSGSPRALCRPRGLASEVGRRAPNWLARAAPARPRGRAQLPPPSLRSSSCFVLLVVPLPSPSHLKPAAMGRMQQVFN